MTRDEAIDVAEDALHYVLDNDYEYLPEEQLDEYQKAYAVLASPRKE